MNIPRNAKVQLRKYHSDSHLSQDESFSDAGYAYKQLRLLGLSDVTARTIQPRMIQRSYDSGDLLWKRGDSHEGWSFLINGIVGGYIPTDQSSSVSLGVFGAGEWFGESYILTGQPSLADYVCLTETDLLVMPKLVVEELLASVSGFGEHMSRLMAKRLQSASEVLALQKYGKPSAKVLIGIAQVANTLVSNEGRIEFQNIIIPLSQGLLASICGVSRTIFSRTVLQLEKMNWLSLTYSNIELLDIERWQALLEVQRNNFHVSFMNSVEEILAAVDDHVPR